MKNDIYSASDIIDSKISEKQVSNEVVLNTEYITLVRNIEKIKYMAASVPIKKRYNFVSNLMYELFEISIYEDKNINFYLARNGIFKEVTLIKIHLILSAIIGFTTYIIARFIVESLTSEIVVATSIGITAFLLLWYDYLWDIFTKSKVKTYLLSNEFKNMLPYEDKSNESK